MVPKKHTRLMLAACLSLASVAYATDYHVAKTGSDSNDGLSLATAFQTIQKGVDTATVAGDQVIVHAGTYTEINPQKSAGRPPNEVNADHFGVIVRHGGTAGNPIVIRAADGEHVVLDLGNTVHPNPNDANLATILDFQGVDAGGLLANNNRRMGFVFTTAPDFVTIRGFEIRNAAQGIRANDGNIGIVVENCTIHDIVGEFPNGPDNIGGVFLQDCNQCAVRDSVIRDISLIRNGVLQTIDNNPNQNTSGVLMFRPTETTIENNDISRAYAGIYRKQAPPTLAGEPRSFYRRNMLHSLVNGLRFAIAGQTNSGHFNQEVSGNIFFDTSIAVVEDAQESSDQSDGLEVFNNTFVNALALDLNTVRNVRFYNNIIVGDLAIRMFANRVLLPANTPVRAAIALSDFNLYFDISDGEPRFIFDSGGALQQNFNTLAAWQGGAGALPEPVPVADPNSQLGDPLFASTPANIHAGDAQLFTLQTNSPAAGLGRVNGIGPGIVDAGAYPNGAFDPVGNPGGDLIGPRSRPAAPTGLSGVGG